MNTFCSIHSNTIGSVTVSGVKDCRATSIDSIKLLSVLLNSVITHSTLSLLAVVSVKQL